MVQNSENVNFIPQPDPFRHYILDLFGTDINHTSGFDPLSDQFTPLFNSVYNYCLDQGVKRIAKIDNPQIKDQEPAQRVAILNRTALIYYAEKKGVDNFDYHLLDIAGMRQADQAGCGDWLLNKISSAIKKGSGDNISGRYGGDEFVVITPKGDDSSQLFLNLQTAISQIEGYYCDTEHPEVIKKQQAQIKNNQIETIQPPITEPDLTIFKTLMSRGMILDQLQIDKIKNRPGFSMEKIQQKYWQANSLYPERVLSSPEQTILSEKINYLNEVYPEFKVALQLCQELDRHNSPDNSQITSRTGATLNFIENVIFDRLLKDVFYSFQHIAEATTQGRYLELFAIDSKFLKEINDNYSYLEGDEVIESVWNQLRSSLGDDRSAFDIARRGGTFILALKADKELSVGTRQQLETITQVEHVLDNKPLSIPLGMAHRVIDETSLQNNDWLRQQLSVIEMAEMKWYEQIASIRQKIVKQPESNLEQLLELYFSNEKRAYDRNKKLSQALQNQKV